MITADIAETVLFLPLRDDVNELYIIAGYATPTMLSWYIENLYHRTRVPIRIVLMIGMVPFDGISASVHEGFIQLIRGKRPQEVEKIECSYIFDAPAVHANVFMWAKDGVPALAYAGSADFVQSAFVGNHRQEVLMECNPTVAMDYYESLIDRSIYAHHNEVEDYVTIYPTHPILDREDGLNRNLDALVGYDRVSLSLVTRSGEPGGQSGLNWGQRPRRNPNEAYIPVPREVARSGFFPLEGQHFMAVTDDRHQLLLRVEQQGDKAITTPARNSDLGEYFRNRLGLPNGAFVTRADLDRYGRTDVVFLKLDEETYYMDFST